MNKKKVPEEVTAEAMNIINDCREGSGESLMSRVRGLQNRFDQLVENCYESRELCEEATAAIQVVTPHTPHPITPHTPHPVTPHSTLSPLTLLTLSPLTLSPLTPPCHPSLHPVTPHSTLSPLTPHSTLSPLTLLTLSPLTPPCHPSLTLSLSPPVLPDQGGSVHRVAGGSTG